MTEQEARKIMQYVKRISGIDLTNKKVLIEGRVESHLLRNGQQSVEEFLNMLESDVTGKLAETLVNVVTTNHTYFMRESEHFDFLKKEVLPRLRESEKNTRDLRIWCGACSTGEEPYILAMILSDFFGFDKANWDTTILATDISTDVLRTALKGIYTQEQLKNVPEAWIRHYFKCIAPEQYSITEELKREVLFRRFNLMNPFPFRKPLHIIFMRNVMIYFDKQTKKQLLQKIYDAMAPGGYLFLGTTESIDRGSIKFKYVQPSVYQKIE